MTRCGVRQPCCERWAEIWRAFLEGRKFEARLEGERARRDEPSMASCRLAAPATAYMRNR